MLLLAVPASAGRELSRYRAKIAIRDHIQQDYDLNRPMAWDCRHPSPGWWRCAFAFQRVNGTRWYCGIGSARLRAGRVHASYGLYRRCHGTLLPS